jgi:tetratricopeptide (TPR) repeat protein
MRIIGCKSLCTFALALFVAFGAMAQQGGLSVDTGHLLQVRTTLVIASTFEQHQLPERAEASYREALEVAERLEPRDVPLVLLWKASFLRRQGRLPDARVAAERALELFLQFLGPDHPSTAVAYSALGSLEHQARDYVKAGPHLRAVIDAYARNPDRGREPEVWIAAWNLALELKDDPSQLAETERLLRLALELKTRLQPYDPWWIARVCQELAMVRGAQGAIDEAVALYERAVSAAESVTGDKDPLLIGILSGQAVSLQRWGRKEASVAAAERTLPVLRRAAQPNWAAIASFTLMLANSAKAKGNLAEADRHFAALLEEYERDPARIPLGFAAAAASHRAGFLYEARRYVEAGGMARRAVALYLQLPPGNGRDLARAHQSLGLILFAERKPTEGAVELRKGIDLMARVDGVSPRDLAGMYGWLADSYFGAGLYRESEAPILKAIELMSARGYAGEQSIYRLRLSMTYRYLERLAEAEALAREVLAERRQRLGDDDGLVADALFHLAAALRWQRKYAEAEPLLRRSLALREKELGRDHKLVLADMNALALSLDGLGRATEAEALFRATLAGRERVLGPEDDEVADTLVSLVWNLRRQKRFAEAAAIAERPLAIYRKALGPDHPTVVRALLPLATIRQERGEFDEADRLFRDALRIRVLTYGADDLKVAESYGDLVSLAGARRQFDEGAGYAAKMLAIVEGRFGADDPRLIVALTVAASFGILSGDLERPETLLKRVLAICERAYGSDSVAVGYAALNMAYLYGLRGRFGDIDAFYERPLRIFEKVLGPTHPAVADALQWRADFEVATGQAEAAAASYDRALSIYTAAFGEDSAARATVMVSKAVLLIQLDRLAEAERLLQEAIALLRKGVGRETTALATALANLGILYRQLDRLAEADDLASQAAAIYRRLYGPGGAPPVVFAPLLMPSPKEI